jgi:hypothetical protein
VCYIVYVLRLAGGIDDGKAQNTDKSATTGYPIAEKQHTSIIM